MTENTKTAMIAINKWIYYTLNYNTIKVEVADFDGEHTEYLPDCFNAFPKSLRKHLAGKFNQYYNDYGSRAVMTKFYAELDGNNRKLLMGWVLNNYNDEQKLSFREEDDEVEKKIFSINVPGDYGYSFAVKCDASYNEKSVINLAFAHELFMEPEDATYAVAEEITDSDYDIEGLKSATYEIL